VTDIFISYSRDDDVPPPDRPDRKGFVTFLDESMRYEFRDLGPDRPSVWRDTKRISLGDQFTPEIEETLRKTKLLVVILSPNWMASRWCNLELDTFAKLHGPEGLRERIVLVNKRYIDPDRRPCLLQGQLGFSFFSRNDDPQDIAGDRDYFDRGEVRDPRYWDQLNALVAHLLRRKPPPPPQPRYPPTGRTIYVAKPASDMRAGYDRIVSELVGKGHTVVPPPEQDIPLNSAVAEIDAALAAAEISIHVLGEKAGEAPEDQLPMVKLQLARATEKTSKDQSAKFHRIVWAPSLWVVPGTGNQGTRETSRHPVEVLARFDRQLATDKVEGDTLSKFVDYVNQHLMAIAPIRPIDAVMEKGGEIRLYLHHCEADSDYALDLAQALQQRKLEALLPAFDGPDSEIKSFNGKQLAECDAVVLCWASASEVWVRAEASGLRDWHQLGRKQQFFYRAVVAAPPPGARKKAGKFLFPRGDIDFVLDLSAVNAPTADLLDPLVPAARPSVP
jgi:hypothetical protein